MPFVDAPSSFDLDRLFVDIIGEEKTGKTSLSLSARGPINILDLNDGLDGVVHKAVSGQPPFTERKKIRIAKHPLPDGVTTDAIRTQSKKVWDSFRTDYVEGVKPRGTLIVDSGTEVYKLSRLSEFGDVKSTGSKKGALDYEGSNSKMRGLLRLYHTGKSNVVLTHQLKDEWKSYTKSDGSQASRTTGKRVRDGFDEIGYMVQIVLRTSKRIDNDGLHFVATLETNRFDPTVEGVEFMDDQFNLPFIFGFCTGTDEESWR